MTSPCEISSSSILTGVRDALVAEIISTPAPAPVTLRRDIAVIIAAALTEVIENIGSLEQLLARAERQVSAFDAARSASQTAGRAIIIDLTEILRRDARPSDGGAA